MPPISVALTVPDIAAHAGFASLGLSLHGMPTCDPWPGGRFVPRMREAGALLPSEADRLSDGLVYGALSDGSENARAAKWRPFLVRMLSHGTPGTDFDCVYGLLLRSFAGNDDRAKMRALVKWAETNLSPREAAEVFRAETRRWLNAGDPAMTADAAERMTRARPDYAVRARRLTALAYAAAGELDRAKAEISRSKVECQPEGWERHELAYLEAWIALQEGAVEQARLKLETIVADDPNGPTARKARTILESLAEETRE